MCAMFAEAPRSPPSSFLPDLDRLSDEATDLALRREAIRFTMGFVWHSVPLMALVVAMMLWLVRHRPEAWPLAALVALLAIASCTGRVLLQRESRQAELQEPAELRRFERRMAWYHGLCCAAWIIATPGLYAFLDAEGRAIYTVLLAGSASLSCFYMAMAGRWGEGVLLAVLVPLVVQTLLPGTRSWPMALVALAFLAGLWRVLHAVRRTTMLAIRRGFQADVHNQALREAMAQAEEAAAAKSRFLATMSHEIRTPMNGVLGALSLLGSAPLSPENAKLLEVARQSSESLLDVLNDVLDYSKIEAGHLDLHDNPAQLAQLAGGVHALFAASADAKSLPLKLAMAHGLPSWISVDEHRLRQVLMNLVANALKFTPSGSVTLRLRPAGISGGQPLIRFEVEDTGIGIPPERMSQLFQPFQQVDQGHQRAFGGSGLGLAISQRLVERMGSRIDVRSVPGQGSCFGFTLRLPLAHAPAAQPVAPVAEAASTLSGRVLVAEDNAVNLMIAAQLLRDMGLTVLEAHDGEEALETLRSEPVDLVLMDGQMPVMDGYAATRAWRAHEQANGLPRRPIMALTANALPEDVRMALDAGMDDHLAKPYGPGELKALLAQWLPRTPG
ncbi:hypothetical protein GCM10009107_12070 [Ideonella azotifigens]|uniref:histidine kinase n=2 Tax=Ideonella azotifigens TaxID=513160 RepID=A0ABP3V2Z5_9BURK